MLDIIQARKELKDKVGCADYDVILKSNGKGIITVSFIDEDTHERVNFKFNESTGVTTIAPREMEKDCFVYQLKEDLDRIKEILTNNNK